MQWGNTDQHRRPVPNMFDPQQSAASGYPDAAKRKAQLAWCISVQYTSVDVCIDFTRTRRTKSNRKPHPPPYLHQFHGPASRHDLGISFGPGCSLSALHQDLWHLGTSNNRDGGGVKFAVRVGNASFDQPSRLRHISLRQVYAGVARRLPATCTRLFLLCTFRREFGRDEKGGKKSANSPRTQPPDTRTSRHDNCDPDAIFDILYL